MGVKDGMPWARSSDLEEGTAIQIRKKKVHQPEGSAQGQEQPVHSSRAPTADSVPWEGVALDLQRSVVAHWSLEPDRRPVAQVRQAFR